MLQVFGLVALLAAPTGPTVRSPYLDAVRLYGRGTEEQAIQALVALRLRSSDQVFDELDGHVCQAAGAKSCLPQDLVRAGIDARDRITATWRQLYPRALALHVEALAASEFLGEQPALDIHRSILHRMVMRIDQIALLPEFGERFRALAMTGRRLLVWTLQYLRDAPRLAETLDVFAAAKIKDVDLDLARADVEELRAVPEVVAASDAVRSPLSSFRRDFLFAQEEARHVEAAVRLYDALLVREPELLEAHLRVAPLLLRRGRIDEARAHLDRVLSLSPDARQRYLATIFLADVLERQGRTAYAQAAYDLARRQWPGAQAPVIALARLRALSGATDAARATLQGVHAERDRHALSDPWMGYIGGQAWRLPTALGSLQTAFEPLP